MKNILNFKKFENSEYDDAKENLEFILLVKYFYHIV